MTEYMKNFTADDMPKKADAPKEVHEEKKVEAPKKAAAPKKAPATAEPKKIEEPEAAKGGQTGDDVETHGVGPSTVEGAKAEEESK